MINLLSTWSPPLTYSIKFDTKNSSGDEIGERYGEIPRSFKFTPIPYVTNGVSLKSGLGANQRH